MCYSNSNLHSWLNGKVCLCAIDYKKEIKNEMFENDPDRVHVKYNYMMRCITLHHLKYSQIISFSRLL